MLGDEGLFFVGINLDIRYSIYNESNNFDMHEYNILGGTYEENRR